MNSKSNGARPVHLIITMIKWIRTSRLPIQLFPHLLSLPPPRLLHVVHLRVKSPFSGPRFVQALAGIRRPVVQTKAIEKRGFGPPLRAGGSQSLAHHGALSLTLSLSHSLTLSLSLTLSHSHTLTLSLSHSLTLSLSHSLTLSLSHTLTLSPP